MMNMHVGDEVEHKEMKKGPRYVKLALAHSLTHSSLTLAHSPQLPYDRHLRPT